MIIYEYGAPKCIDARGCRRQCLKNDKVSTTLQKRHSLGLLYITFEDSLHYHTILLLPFTIFFHSAIKFEETIFSSKSWISLLGSHRSISEERKLTTWAFSSLYSGVLVQHCLASFATSYMVRWVSWLAIMFPSIASKKVSSSRSIFLNHVVMWISSSARLWSVPFLPVMSSLRMTQKL